MTIPSSQRSRDQSNSNSSDKRKRPERSSLSKRNVYNTNANKNTTFNVQGNKVQSIGTSPFSTFETVENNGNLPFIGKNMYSSDERLDTDKSVGINSGILVVNSLTKAG